MKKLLSMIFISSAALALAGCLGISRDASELQIDWEESRFVRVEIAPFNWRGTDIKGMEVQTAYLALGFGLDQNREGFGMLVPESLNLQRGDIVDVYRGNEGVGEENYLAAPKDLRTQVLGIVCRRDDAGCERNSTPQLTIGWGRKMRGAHEYQGVAAEAKQRIYPGEGNSTDVFTPGWGKPLNTSYARRGISADYEDPPATQQQPHPNWCEGWGGCAYPDGIFDDE